jgi:cell division cycle protein 20 (cofactor of APC complex)
MALMRSISAASFRSSSPIPPTYPEISAKHYLRNTKIAIDFAVPSAGNGDSATATATEATATATTNTNSSVLPLSLSTQNIVLFSRAERVHFKNLSSGEDIGQLCRVQDSLGFLRCIVCAGWDQPSIVALGTSKGIQLWDIACKKMTASWSTRDVTAMHWNGPVLTVGGVKGTIRHFDTRTKETPSMKEQARKVTRHQARISRLAWNVDGKFMASGDESGTVYCWDSRQRSPLDIGEFVQRRKKMQHPGAITVRPYSPPLTGKHC